MELPAAVPAAPQRRFQLRSSGGSGTRDPVSAAPGAGCGVRGQVLGRGMPVGGFTDVTSAARGGALLRASRGLSGGAAFRFGSRLAPRLPRRGGGESGFRDHKGLLSDPHGDFQHPFCPSPVYFKKPARRESLRHGLAVSVREPLPGWALCPRPLGAAPSPGTAESLTNVAYADLGTRWHPASLVSVLRGRDVG